MAIAQCAMRLLVGPENGGATLPPRPAPASRNSASGVLHCVPVLRMQFASLGGSFRSLLPPTPLSGPMAVKAKKGYIMELKHLNLSQLSVSPANMRRGRRAPDISDLLPSVRERGVFSRRCWSVPTPRKAVSKSWQGVVAIMPRSVLRKNAAKWNPFPAPSWRRAMTRPHSKRR